MLVADAGVLDPTFTDNTITAFGGTTPTVVEFLFDEGEGGATVEGTNERAGSPFFAQTVTANFHVLSAAKQLTLKSIVEGRKRIIIENFNSEYYLLGFESGMVASLNQLFGTAPGDASGYALTMTANESDMAFECTAAIDDLTITAATL